MAANSAVPAGAESPRAVPVARHFAVVTGGAEESVVARPHECAAVAFGAMDEEMAGKIGHGPTGIGKTGICGHGGRVVLASKVEGCRQKFYPARYICRLIALQF